MTINIERLLRRVVDEVFNDTDQITFHQHPRYPNDVRASVTSASADTKRIEIRATYEWFSGRIPDLNVGAITFEYADNEAEKEQALREITMVMRAYLRDEEQIEYRRDLLGRRRRPEVTIHSEGSLWVLGRRASSVSSSTG